MYCKYCGKEMEDGARFCSSCGKETAPDQSGNSSEQDIQRWQEEQQRQNEEWLEDQQRQQDEWLRQQQEQMYQ